MKGAILSHAKVAHNAVLAYTCMYQKINLIDNGSIMKFIKTTEHEDKIAYQNGLEIYGELRKKYCNNNITDLDIILNSLCAAIVRLFELNSLKKDAEYSSLLVKDIIYKNLK
jgi:hypothetical protein